MSVRRIHFYMYLHPVGLVISIPWVVKEYVKLISSHKLVLKLLSSMSGLFKKSVQDGVMSSWLKLNMAPKLFSLDTSG